MPERKAVEVGQRWSIKLYGHLTVVKIQEIHIVPGYHSGFMGRNTPSRWRAYATNELTGKTITLKSVAKLRTRLTDDGHLAGTCKPICDVCMETLKKRYEGGKSAQNTASA